MGLRHKIEQYGVFLVGLMVGGGFMFGGILTFSGLVDTGSSQGENEFEAEIPSQNYVEGSFDLDRQEQLVLAAQNRVVFVNAFYENEQQKENMAFLESLPQEFNNRVYVQAQNSTSDSPLLIEFGITEFPQAVVVGSSRNARALTIQDVSKSEVESAICQVIGGSLDELAAKCV